MKTRVMIAEGDAALREACREFLEGHGYEVETARDGLDCYAKLRERPPAALVLSRNLLWGGADGVMAWMRSDRNASSVPVVMIANERQPEGLDDAAGVPVIACLQKPVRMSALLQCLMSVGNHGMVAEAAVA